MASCAYLPTTTFIHFLFFLLHLLFLLCFSGHTSSIASDTHTNISCIDQEREVLLRVKAIIHTDTCGLLTTWVHDDTLDCCKWAGVHCSNRTHHVIGLNLSGANYYPTRCLEGGVSPYLFELKYLESLDLSFNYFQGEPIPPFIGYLLNLRHLKLSNAGFTGEIPSQLGNLSDLTSLDLSHNSGTYANDLSWISQLTSLRDIDLSGSDLSKATDWLEIVSNLPVLSVLTMDDCHLSWTNPSAFCNYSNSLHTIQLSGNSFSHYSIFQWFFDSYYYLMDDKPIGFQNVNLDLSDNQLKGPIPIEFGDLHFLSYLNLSNNYLHGLIPTEFGNMKRLSHLDLSSNQLKGDIQRVWGTMNLLSYLDLSNNRLQGSIPSSIWKSESILHLDLSYNQILGPIPSLVSHSQSLTYLDLSNNQLVGRIPKMLWNIHSLSYLDLSSNSFSGPIPEFALPSQLLHLDLSYNLLTGKIALEDGIFQFLRYLDLSFNHLLGSIPPNLWRFGIGAFTGNNDLCGEPLPNNCSLEDENVVNKDGNGIFPGLYVSTGFGLCFGFLGFWSILMVKDSWRYAYFKSIADLISIMQAHFWPKS